MKKKLCPNCGMDLELRSISSFDPTGTAYGCVWYCQFCGWHDLTNFVKVTKKNCHLVKPAVSFFEINFVRWKAERGKDGTK